MKYILILLVMSFAFSQDFIFEETYIGIGDPPNSLPPLHIFEEPPIEIYDIIIVDGKEMKIIKDTNNSAWKKYPSLKTKVIMTVQYDDDWGISSRMEIIPHGKIDTIGIWYLNYKEYWNDMLLCEPNPDAILEITFPAKIEPNGTWGSVDPERNPNENLTVYDCGWIQDNDGFWIRADTSIIYSYGSGCQPNQKLDIVGEGRELFGEPKKQKE